ncbi:hypothetical protein EV384_4190 [Micromonospora kangleipakensis]|uniref:Uncharacterized protein n=1 Tax=Micromonospora kangleipakensis TaxID=1077942 RepID=A0A4Q8BCP3_9ACTN|nr:hypothetical protein [Micromonospora kangleipakensis]RZU75637.1 hypothetical protein EV384_4190 [Micromonospora kangleipakensis]
MTRPEEPTEALPTRAVPLPAAPVDPDRTRTLGATDSTVHLNATDSTMHLGGTDATVHLGDTDATVHLGPPDSTVRLGADTVYLGSPDATVHLGGPDATTRLGATDATVHLAGAAATTGGTEPTVHFPASGGTEPTATGPATSTYPAAGASPAYPGVAGDARAATGRSQPAPGGEVRFGPGVPATPPAAPAWPAAATARRPRPLWRRVVSVLSTLLTVVLLVAVGFYLWQRISPLEVEGVTVAVPQPAGDRCDVTVDVVATVRTNGRGGVLRYQWLRSDAAPGSLLSERVGRGQRTVLLTLRWSFSGVGTTKETATVNIIEPSPVQAGTEVSYRCRRG